MPTFALPVILANGTLADAAPVMQDFTAVETTLNSLDTDNLSTNSYLWSGPQAQVAAPGVDANAIRFNLPHANMRLVRVTAYCEDSGVAPPATVTFRIQYSTDNFATSTELILPAAQGTATINAGVATSLSGAQLNNGFVMGANGQVRIGVTATAVDGGAVAPMNLTVHPSFKGLLRTSDGNP